jgi:hypothetical protein
MSQAGRFPDDPELPDSLLRVEQVLGGQKPRPVTFDVEAILKVALEPSSGGASRTSESANPSNARRSTWMALGATWMGGALAGSLVTAVLMAPPAVSEVARKSATVSNRTPHSDVTVDEGEDAGQVTRTPPSQDEQRAPDSRWSAADYVVANRIMNLGHSVPGGMTLQAGSYVRLSSTDGTWLAPGSPIARQRDGDRVVAPDRETEGARSSPSALDRDQLLQELLGDGATSTL